MILLVISILILYALLLGWLVVGYNKVKSTENFNNTAKTKFSIIIPFRNEEDNLNNLLNSIYLLEYPRNMFEVILVDDDSNDASSAIIKRFTDYRPDIDIKLINSVRASQSPKKDAIITAITQAQFSWVLSTDADCRVPEKWLQSFDSLIQESPSDFIVGPVTYDANKTFIEQFQSFDFLSLQSVTIAGFGLNKPFLCNGANLCYNKHTFLKMNGFEGNEHIASGDDLFLMEKMIHNFRQLSYLKSENALVSTRPQPNIKTLLSQRIRWSAKMTSSKNLISKLIGVLVFLTNCSLVIAFIAALVGFFSFKNLLLLFIIKLLIDLILLLKIHRFYKQAFSLPFYLISSFVYPFFSTFVVIASLVSGFKWKGRSFKK